MKLNLKRLLALTFASALVLTGCIQDPVNNGNGNGGSNGGSDSGSGSGISGNGGSYNVVPLDVGNFEVADTSVQMAKNMAIGWNLGNALDASGNGDWAYKGEYNPAMEYSWLPHKVPASKQLIQTVKAAGFKTIRIPISWHNQMGRNDSTYTIYPKYLARVKELVDWSLDEGMCVIINIHHDNLSVNSAEDVGLSNDFIENNGDISQIDDNPGFALSKNAAVQAKSKAFITRVWEQVAEYFKDYDNRLVFELLNEPRCIGTDLEWGFYGDNSSKAKTYCDIITDYEQAALDVIRASGEKNANRYVMCPSYACSPDYLSSYKLPVDTAEDKLLYAVHAYTPGDFCLEGNKTVYDSEVEKSIDYLFSQLKSKITNENIGIVMGEASASDKDNYDSRIKWAKYYFEKSVEAGVPVVLWDNEQAIVMGAKAGGENHGYFNRKTCKVTWPEMIEAMMKAVYKDKYSVQDSGDTGNDDDQNSPSALAYTVNYTGRDGEADFDVQSDWVSFTIEFEEVVEGMLIVCKSDALKEDHGSWKEYYASYIPVNGKSLTITLADILTKMKTDNANPVNPITKISVIGIQNTKDSANEFKVVKSSVKKSNNEEISVTPHGDGWNASVN